MAVQAPTAAATAIRPFTVDVRQHDAVRERTLAIAFLEPGVEAYAFTFG